jgi:hypothetical protein
VEIAPGDVWAVGSASAKDRAIIVHRTDSGWTLVPPPHLPAGASAELSSLSGTDPDDIWAVGDVYLGTQDRTLTIHWDGSSWTRTPSPSPGSGPECALTSVDAISSSNVWAVGTASDRGAPLVEHWDGISWSVTPTPKPGGAGAYYDVESVSSSSATNVWASGLFSSGTRSKALMLHWNGTRWLDDPSATPSGGSLRDLPTHVVSPGVVWAVGDREIGDLSHSVAERHLASGWHVIGTPATDFLVSIQGIDSTATTDVWAVGAESAVQAGPQPLLMHWDGHSWRQTILAP